MFSSNANVLLHCKLCLALNAIVVDTIESQITCLIDTCCCHSHSYHPIARKMLVQDFAKIAQLEAKQQEVCVMYCVFCGVVCYVFVCVM